MTPVDAHDVWETMAASDFAFALIDPSTHTFIEANEAYAALIGVDVEKVKGLSILSLYPPEIGKSIKSLNAAFVRGTLEVTQGQTSLRTLTGQVIEVKGWARRIEGLSGRRLIVTAAARAESDKLSDDRAWVALAPHVFGRPPVELAVSQEEAVGRAEQLEQHLFRIQLEVRAAGLRGIAGEETRSDLAERLSELSSRQREIVSRLLAGDRVQQIARDIYLSPSTVRNHLTAVFRKFGVHSQAELITILKSPNGARRAH